MKGLIWLYIAVQLCTVFVYGYDKRQARRSAGRVSERTLLLLGLLFPGAALAGMYLFRHKTRHRRFTILIPLALLAQLTLWIVYFSQ